MPAGILLVDKPQGLTSHDVVARVRRLAGTRKVGHAGTLDPMATGLLIIGIDSATRLLHYIVGLDKEYVATIRLGQSSSTDDAEGELSERVAVSAITNELIAFEALKFIGEIDQVPSSVSAIKVNGERAYAKVRAGEDVKLAARRIRIEAFEISDVRYTADFVDVDVRVVCSSGTYIRALARDLGNKLGVGGHLTMLRRTRIGRFAVADASTLEALAEPATDVASAVIPPARAAELAMDVLNVTEQDAIDLGHGKRIACDGFAKGALAAAIDPAGRLIAVVESRGDSFKVATGFPQESA